MSRIFSCPGRSAPPRESLGGLRRVIAGAASASAPPRLLCRACPVDTAAGKSAPTRCPCFGPPTRPPGTGPGAPPPVHHGWPGTPAAGRCHGTREAKPTRETKRLPSPCPSSGKSAARVAAMSWPTPRHSGTWQPAAIAPDCFAASLGTLGPAGQFRHSARLCAVG